MVACDNKYLLDSKDYRSGWAMCVDESPVRDNEKSEKKTKNQTRQFSSSSSVLPFYFSCMCVCVSITRIAAITILTFWTKIVCGWSQHIHRDTCRDEDQAFMGKNMNFMLKTRIFCDRFVRTCNSRNLWDFTTYILYIEATRANAVNCA